ncbi:hypothetical protein [Phenylobacterium sp.]|uniref:hypothetical protein n=1 Tax=Phenylobacterium sp. TaxID=1871053 RepID=UPI0035B01A4F
MSDPSNRPASWIDLKIPLWGLITLAIGLLVQTASLVIWGAKMDQRVQMLEQRTNQMAEVSETVARMDERTLSLVTSVNRIESRLSEQEMRR